MTAATSSKPRGRGRSAARARSAAAGWFLLLPALLLVVLFFLVPMVIFFRYGFGTTEDNGIGDSGFTLEHYKSFLTDGYYIDILLSTVKIAAIATVFSVLVSYPLAYAMWRTGSDWLRVTLGVVAFLPMLVSSVVRAYGWQVVLADHGPLAWFLDVAHISDNPPELLFQTSGVVIGMVHMFLPFVVYPVYTSLQQIEPEVLESSSDLGASWFTTFRRVTFRLSLPGLVAGAQICFTLVLGSLVIPSILGGGRVKFLPVTIYNDTSSVEWPIASVESTVLLVGALAAVLVFGAVSRRTKVK
ncbi:ABC transporter permease [Actinomadura soli]|uniref:ABC transporter permease n=1 Tax=Actinomadura soli TaxID=2508997 RepID=A0A5C4JGW6_9ACTN|nr:ABC transporter permease [Actinomadura soli]TMR05010.1 ABC transporter permease [Actinomadura soli]